MEINSQQGTVAPQYSPDGKWWWNGQEWVALPAAPLNPGFSTPDPGSRGLAIASLITSLTWLVGLWGLSSVLGIVLGHLSRRRDRKAGARPNGMALAGLIIGYVGLGLTVILLAIAIPVFLSQRDKANDTALKSGLSVAAVAQQTWAVDAGTFTTSTTDLLSTGYRPGSLVDVEIVAADSTSFCLAAASRSFDEVMYYSSLEDTFSSVPCG